MLGTPVSYSNVLLQDLVIDRLFGTIRDAVIVAEATTGRIVLWNQAAAKIFGYSPSEASEMNVEVLVPERLKAQLRADISGYGRTGHERYIDSTELLELPAVRKDGAEIWIEMSLSPIEPTYGVGSEGQRYMLAIVRDVTERKRAEEALSHNEERFRLLVEGVKDYAIVMLDPEGRVASWNEGARRIKGHSHQEILGRHFSVCYPEEDKARGKPARGLEIAREKGTYEEEGWQVRKDGSRFWASVLITALRDEEGNLRGFSKVIRDITERKRTERALIESEQRFRQLFENSADALFVHDEQGRFVDCNVQACRVLGYAREELLERTVADVTARLISEEERREKKGKTLWERALRGDPGRIVGFDENELVRKDGSTFPVEVGVGAIEYGGQCMIFASARDISERKRAEEALKESEAKYRTLVEQIPAVTYIEELDFGEPEWNMIYVSPQVQALLGYSPEEYMSKPKIWEELLHSDDRERVLAEDARTERSGMPFRVEYRIFTRNGDVAWIRDEAVLVRDEEGRPLFWQGVMYDITDQKRTEEEVRRLNEELEQRVRRRTAQLEAFNSELEAFSYSISHDLRSPLRAINGFSQILMEDYEDKLDVEGKSYLRRLSAASHRMGQLIDDLLDLSRMTRGQMRRERVNLSTLAQAIVEELRNTQPEHEVEVIIEEGLVANGDGSLLRAVLENLLGNAWKFTKNQPHPRIEFGRLEHEDTPTYYVRDNGVGFDMAYVYKLFGAFQRLHSMSKYEGTGIGLATVQRIIHRHGGRVWAKGEVGKGASFYFTL